MLGLPDTYTVRARIFPALLGGLPGLALAAVMVSWRQLGLSHVIAMGAGIVLLYAFSDLARRLGKKLEADLFDKMGGKPSTAMLRYRDAEFDQVSKAKWLAFMAKKIGDKPPVEPEERANTSAADRYYDRCGAWLREHTRDQKKFKLIFEENVIYGFRRNLLGMKSPALVLNAFVVLACAIALWFRLPFSADDNVSIRLVYVLIVTACHALYFLFAVNRNAVMEAARQYGRQLILACDTLAGGATTARVASKRRAKRGVQQAA